MRSADNNTRRPNNPSLTQLHSLRAELLHSSLRAREKCCAALSCWRQQTHSRVRQSTQLAREGKKKLARGKQNCFALTESFGIAGESGRQRTTNATRNAQLRVWPSVCERKKPQDGLTAQTKLQRSCDCGTRRTEGN